MLDDEIVLWKADFSADQLRDYAREGVAMPDGSYPVPDADHLRKAIDAVGRGTNNAHGAIRKHIISRAKALGLSKQLPDTWSADGTVTKTEDVELAAAAVWKSEQQQLVYGVVLTPGVEDSQGDVVDADEIEKAAHRWLAEFRKQDVQHAEITAGDTGEPIMEVVESFVAPADIEIAGRPVMKGAWVLAARVNDDATWQRVMKDELTGWSIGGSGVRQPITA